MVVETKPVPRGGYNLPSSIKTLSNFRDRSLPIGYIHQLEVKSPFKVKKMLEQVGVFKWVEPCLSPKQAKEYQRFHSTDTMLDIIPNIPFSLANPHQKQTDVAVDNYILNNCLEKEKPRIFLGYSALSLIREGAYIAEEPYISSSTKRKMKLTLAGGGYYPNALLANMDCHGNQKGTYAIDTDGCPVLRSYIEDKNIIPLAYIEHPAKDKDGKTQKHIVAFKCKDSNDIGILYNPEMTEHLESSREFQNTAIRYGCIFFMSVLMDTLHLIQNPHPKA